MSNTACVPLIYSELVSDQVNSEIQKLLAIIEQVSLPLQLQLSTVEPKLTQKVRKQLSDDYDQPILIIDEKLQLSLLAHRMSVSPEWKSLQRRVVTAGRKSELLLQACKLTDQSRVLDATAGFGHDSLILSSTGAQVTMLERDPLMALLLIYEQQLMAQQKNWQKLMSRLRIVCQDSAQYMSKKGLSETSVDIETKGQTSKNYAFDVVYLDPMFPENSYQNIATGKGAKVGKHMQALHLIASPPDKIEEQKLLDLALDAVAEGGRVVVKRPVTAPPFAEASAEESWQNEVLRFDGYFKKS